MKKMLAVLIALAVLPVLAETYFSENITVAGNVEPTLPNHGPVLVYTNEGGTYTNYYLVIPLEPVER